MVMRFMKSQKSILEALKEMDRMIQLGKKDQLPKAQMRVFMARFDTLKWVLED